MNSVPSYERLLECFYLIQSTKPAITLIGMQITSIENVQRITSIFIKLFDQQWIHSFLKSVVLFGNVTMMNEFMTQVDQQLKCQMLQELSLQMPIPSFPSTSLTSMNNDVSEEMDEQQQLVGKKERRLFLVLYLKGKLIPYHINGFMQFLEQSSSSQHRDNSTLNSLRQSLAFSLSLLFPSIPRSLSTSTFPFSILTWNVLAEKYSNLSGSSHDLTFDYRLSRALHKIAKQDADIVTLQECDRSHSWIEGLQPLGYRCLYTPRAHGPEDGCMIAYKYYYEVERYYPVSFDDLKSIVDTSQLVSYRDESNIENCVFEDDEELRERAMRYGATKKVWDMRTPWRVDFHNIGVIVVFRDKRSRCVNGVNYNNLFLHSFPLLVDC